MITIPQLVEEHIAKTPFLEEALSQNLINYSALARVLRPQFETRLLKEVQTGSIVMALKRLSLKLSSNSPDLQANKLTLILKELGDITVRSNILEFTFVNSPDLAEKQRKLMQAVKDHSNTFLTVTDGVHETTFFASKNLESEIEHFFQGETVKQKLTGLCSLTIIIPATATEVPGVYYSVLKKLAWAGINFVEVVSSFTELTIFVENKNVDKAFSVLKNG